MARVELHRATYERETRAAGLRWGHKVGQEVVNESRQRCPVDEGALRASIDYVLSPGAERMKVVVGSALPYAEFFHTGTGIYGPHGSPVVPLRQRSPSGGPAFLKFKPKGSGEFVFARSVKGMKKNPFLVDGLAAVMGNAARRRGN